MLVHRFEVDTQAQDRTCTAYQANKVWKKNKSFQKYFVSKKRQQHEKSNENI
jgi:hypothetical protein